MSVLYILSVLVMGNQVLTLDAYDGPNRPAPLLQATETHLYVAGENVLFVYDTAGLLENTYALTSYSYDDDLENFTITTLAPLSAFHKHRLLMTFMATDQNNRRVFRTVILDQLGREVGLVINPSLPDSRSVYFRDFYDVGDGTLIANTWQPQTEWRQEAISLDRVLIDDEETVAGDTFFRIRFAGENFGVKFFESEDFMAANKAVYLNRRSDGYYVVGLPMENKVDLYLPKGGMSAKKVASKELGLEGFQRYKEGDETKQALFSNVLGMTQVADGMWVAYYPQFNPRMGLPQAEIKLQKLGAGATTLSAPNRLFGCFANGNAYFLSLEDGTLEIETVELP